MKQWNLFMPLLDEKYPAETRMVAVACLMGMLGGDSSSLPPMVFFDKCMRKREILKGYKGSDSDGNWTTERFLNAIYALCGETQNQQLLFAGSYLLIAFHFLLDLYFKVLFSRHVSKCFLKSLTVLLTKMTTHLMDSNSVLIVWLPFNRCKESSCCSI